MKRILFYLVLITVSHSSFASVTMIGTRIIINSGMQEKTVQFQNPDPTPYIVELKLTEESMKDTSEVPFTAVPPVFRIEPNQGQSVRLISSQAALALPQDRESIFYLSFTQIPAIKNSDSEKNQLIIAVKSRVKTFYRPENLKGEQSEAYKLLDFSIKNNKVLVKNPTGYYISISSGKFLSGNQIINLSDHVMLEPFSTSEWSPDKKISSLKGGKLLITQVNDYGAYVEKSRDL